MEGGFGKHPRDFFQPGKTSSPDMEKAAVIRVGLLSEEGCLWLGDMWFVISGNSNNAELFSTNKPKKASL